MKTQEFLNAMDIYDEDEAGAFLVATLMNLGKPFWVKKTKPSDVISALNGASIGASLQGFDTETAIQVAKAICKAMGKVCPIVEKL